MGCDLPRLLVIGNNSLSDNNSNGRTLAGFLRGWSKTDISQIYITGGLPESTVCDRFFRITDRDVLDGIIKLKQNVGGIAENNAESNRFGSSVSDAKTKKSIVSMAVRDIMWNTNIWWTKKLRNWIEEFNPGLLLLFAGDSTFTINMALKISSYYDLPLAVYNSEGYYFKDKNYLKGGPMSELLYPAFHSCFKVKFKTLMSKVKAEIYINDKLKNDYDKEFGGNSHVIYTSSNVKYNEKKNKNKAFVTSYLGNLGLGREDPLIEIAKALQEINKDYKLNVYGKVPNENVRHKFEECGGINYCGVVSYDEVIDIMYKSDLLVHGESFDDFTRWDLKYAFTTKIADSLSCGTCFMLYAPKELACTEYLKENDCAFVVCEKQNLKDTLTEIINNDELRLEYARKARQIAEKNHNSQKACSEFEKILKEAVEHT